MYNYDYNKERKTNLFYSLLIVILGLALTAITLLAQSRYVLPCDKSLLIESEKVLLAQVGVKEKTGKNDGIEVERYLASVGLSKGNPYCAAGQYYCFAVINKSRTPIPRTGLANGMFNYAQKSGLKTIYRAKKNDLIVWKTPQKSTGHIERIYLMSVNGNCYTVGFNTGSGDPREGSGVFKKKRNLYHPLGRMQVRGLVGFNG